MKNYTFGLICVLTPLAYGCGADATDSSSPAGTVDDGPVLTPAEVAQVHAQNDQELAAHGALYTLQAGVDHEIVFVESEGGSGIVERIGPNAESGAAAEDLLSQRLTPAEIFHHFRPQEAVPAVLADATARLYPSAEHLAVIATSAGTAPSQSGGLDPSASSDSGFPMLPESGLRLTHATSDGTHFRNGQHTFDGVTDVGCPRAKLQSPSFEVQFICWLNRTGGGYVQNKSSDVIYHFGLFGGSPTLLSLTASGSKKWEITVLNAEIWRATWWGGVSGYNQPTAVTTRLSWGGSGRDWHAGATYWNTRF